MTQPTWTPELEKRLGELMADGLSAGQVAADLGMTRNMVIGKAGRLGLEWNSTRTPWPHEATQTLIRLVGQGLSPDAVAESMGKSCNSIRKRARWLGLRWQKSPQKPQRGSNSFTRSRAALPPTPIQRRSQPVCEPLNLPLQKLMDHHCRYATVGECAPYLFCGRQAVPGESWCLDHMRIVYTPRKVA